jgi:hypothetical protein
MFAHPWAIVIRSALQSAVDTEEANVRPSLGDRSPPRQAYKDARSSPGHTRTQARVRTFAQHWAIVRPRMMLLHVTYLGHLFFPSLSPTPRNPPSRRPLLTSHNHHKSPTKSSPTTTKHHSRPPSATTSTPRITTSSQSPTLPHLHSNPQNLNFYTIDHFFWF